jgi:hypothetical protein
MTSLTLPARTLISGQKIPRFGLIRKNWKNWHHAFNLARLQDFLAKLTGWQSRGTPPQQRHSPSGDAR